MVPSSVSTADSGRGSNGAMRGRYEGGIEENRRA